MYGRNHSSDDIEATIQEITRGRSAAISVPDGHTEQLVLIIEHKKRGDSEEDAMQKLDIVKREVISAISKSHGLASRTPSGTAWFDSDHHTRQGQRIGVCRAVSAGSVRGLGRLGVTWDECETWSRGRVNDVVER